MREMMKVMALVAVMAMPTFAASGTLYQQENTAADGTPAINAYGKGPGGLAGIDGADNWTNWKWQDGSGSSSAVYAGDEGWIEITSYGDSDVEVEADIEMYYENSISGNKVYFHIGNLFAADEADLTAYINGTFRSNNGMWQGISFPVGSKAPADFEKVDGLFTGKIINGMHSANDTWRPQDNNMDIKFLMQWDDGISGWSGWQVPGAFGYGAHDTIPDTLWWLVGGGAPGDYLLQWKVELLPTPYQPDGDYYLDPAVVAAPVL